MQSPLPPTLRKPWLGGHFRPFMRDRLGFLTKLSKLGDISHFMIGPQLAFFINHPDFIRDVLVTNHAKFEKGRALKRAKKLLGEGLLTSEHQFHLRQRRMIQPAFHRQRIANYGNAMIEFGEKMGDEWKEGEELDISKEMMRLTLNIVGKTLFSANVEDEADEVGKSMTDLVEMFDYLLLPFSDLLEKLPLPHSKRFKKAKNTLDAVIYDIINKRRKSGEDTGDLLSMLLLAQDEDDGGQMDDRQIRDECLTLFLAGHETTANALTWTWFLLSNHPEIEGKFHDELDKVLGNRAPTPDDFQKLKFTEAVLAESMRLFPPAWGLGRLAMQKHEIAGYEIPEKSLILMSMYVLQRDERFWDNAETFNPERFLTANAIKEASNKFIYFPFGGGVRRCIGEQFAWTEGVLLLASLGRKWKLKMNPGQKIVPQAMITLRSKYGLKMRAERRN